MLTLPAQQVMVFVFLLIQPDRPLSDADSLYALGELGWIWRAGAIVSDIGVQALAVGLAASLAPGTRVKAVLVILVIAGFALMATGIFATDAPLDDGTVGYTTGGVLHFVFGILGLLSLLIAAYLLKGVFQRDARWSSTSRPTMAGVVAACWCRPPLRATRGLGPGWRDATSRLHTKGDLGSVAGVEDSLDRSRRRDGMMTETPTVG